VLSILFYFLRGITQSEDSTGDAARNNDIASKRFQRRRSKSFGKRKLIRKSIGEIDGSHADSEQAGHQRMDRGTIQNVYSTCTQLFQAQVYSSIQIPVSHQFK